MHICHPYDTVSFFFSDIVEWITPTIANSCPDTTVSQWRVVCVLPSVCLWAGPALLSWWPLEPSQPTGHFQPAPDADWRSRSPIGRIKVEKANYYTIYIFFNYTWLHVTLMPLGFDTEPPYRHTVLWIFHSFPYTLYDDTECNIKT